MNYYNLLLFYYLINTNLEQNIKLIDLILDVINKLKFENYQKWKYHLTIFFKIMFHKRQFKNDKAM